MNQKIEILSRFILTIGLIFFIVKFLGPTLFRYFWDLFSNKNTNNNNDLSYLIEKKKSALNMSGKKTSKDQSIRKQTGKFEKMILKNLKDPNTNHEELKKILEFIDNTRWGEGKYFRHLLKELRDKERLDIDLTLIGQSTRLLLKGDFFFSNKKSELTLNSILNKTKVYIYIYSLFYEINNNLKNNLLKLSLLLKVEENLLIAAIYGALYKKLETNYLIHSLEIIKNPQKKKAYFKKNQDKKFILSLILTHKITRTSHIKSMLSKELEILESITPLPKLTNKNDLKTAYIILNCKPEDSDETIKKSYQKLAKLKHPDKLKSKGIPDKFHGQATQNFTVLKNAYDIIKKLR